MTISSQQFSRLISEFPEERETVERLVALCESGKGREMTLDHLVLRLEPRSTEALVRILERLAYDKSLRRYYRIESPGTKGPIDDFDRFEDIPPRVTDWHTGAELVVTPQDLKVIYSLV